MTVIVNETATNLSTTNGFYRVEAYQADMTGAAGTNYLTTTRKQQAVTFSNSGNCRGIVMGFAGSNSNAPGSSYTGNAVVALCELKAMTISIASPAVVTSTGHGLSANQEINFVTTGALPTGISTNTTYYVLSTGLGTDTFRFSTSIGGSAVNTSGGQSGTHTLYVVRASKTRSVSDIINNITYPFGTGFVKPFKFATPYAVDTTASKWAFRFWCDTTSTYNLDLKMNTALTSYSYFAWCDNQVTFSSGNDTLIAAAPVTIDQTATLKAIPYTTNTGIVHGMCALACSSDTPAYDQNGMIVWKTTGLSASYTLTIDGCLIISTHAGFHVGNTGYSIPIAYQAKIILLNTVTSTGATAGYSGFYSPCLARNYYGSGGSIMMFGEVPAVRKCTLTADAAVGATTITVDDSTGFVNGDVVYITKQDGIRGIDTMSTGSYTVSSAPTSTSLVISAITTLKRLTGAFVIKALGYGILVQNDTPATSYSRHRLNNPNNFVCEGVAFRNNYFILNYTTGPTNFWEATSANTYTYPIYFNKCVFESYQSVSLYNYFMYQCQISSAKNWLINECYGIHEQLPMNIAKMSYVLLGFYGGNVSYTNNIITNHQSVGIGFGNGSGIKNTITGNIVHNSLYGATISGLYSIHTGNYYYGCSYGTGLGTSTYSTNNTGNTIERCRYAVAVQDGSGLPRSTVGCSENNNTYININYLTILFPDSYVDYEIKSPTGNITAMLAVTSSGQGAVSPPSYFRITDSNDVSNADYGWKFSGNIARTGTGLADTTVHTAGGFAIRMESISSIDLLDWVQSVPTGNIQNKDMGVGVWVKLNSANYYAGTYQMPRLTVTYDDTSVVYAEAAQTTDWQYLQVPFRPLTTIGQISVSLNCKTSATSTDAYVYWDDMSILYPAGSTLSLGSLDLWSSGLPVMPTISTLASAQDVWAVSPSIMGTGTIGKTVVNTEIKADDSAILRGVI